jgi:hypothetical protein
VALPWRDITTQEALLRTNTNAAILKNKRALSPRAINQGLFGALRWSLSINVAALPKTIDVSQRVRSVKKCAKVWVS